MTPNGRRFTRRVSAARQVDCSAESNPLSDTDTLHSTPPDLTGRLRLATAQKKGPGKLNPEKWRMAWGGGGLKGQSRTEGGSYKMIQLFIVAFSEGYTESVTGHSDYFTLSWYTCNAIDSSKIQDVTVFLTDFMGHFEKPASEECSKSDSTGLFSLDKCPDYKNIDK